MDTFAQNLKKLRRQKGLNQEELAEKLNIRKTTVSNYETGYSKPRMAVLNQMAELFGVSVDQLIQSTPTVMKSPGPVAEDASTSVPIYAGIANLDFPGAPLYALHLPIAFLGGGEFFGLTISGDRMDRAGLSAGSIAIVRKQAFFDNGDVVVVSLGSEPAFVCRYYTEGELISLIYDSSNPLYRPLLINPKEQTIKILGKVVNTLQKVM